MLSNTQIQNIKKSNTKSLINKAQKLGVENAEFLSRNELVNMVLDLMTAELTIANIPLHIHQEPVVIEEAPTPFSEFKKIVDNRKVEYYRGEIFPLQHIAGSLFETADGKKFNFSELGLRSIRYHDRRIMYADNTAWLVDGEFDKFATATQNNERLTGSFILSIIDGMVSGIMKNYNDVSDKEIVKMIEDAGLQNLVYRHTMNQYNTTVYIKLYEEQSTKIIAGLAITNGQTGHVALSFSHFIDFAKFDWIKGFSVKNSRHMSKVYLTKDALKSALEETKEIQVLNVLSDSKVVECSYLIYQECGDDEKSIELVDSIISGLDSDSSILDFISELTAYYQVRGYKGRVQNLANAIVNSIVG